MKVEKMFPIQGEHDNETRAHRPAGQVPWGVAELAYQVYVKECGSSQSLQKLADRGGFGWSELAYLLKGTYFNGERIPAVNYEERK